MEKTDRQTDKAVHWNSAIFDISGNWAKLETLPHWVKEVHKQQETCPTTGRLHYQVHIVCNQQQRLSALRGWIQTHWKPIRGQEYIQNSIAYCSKTLSAVPGTHEVVKGEKYYRIHELLYIIAMSFVPTWHLGEVDSPEKLERYTKQYLFKSAARDLVSRDLRWIDKLSNPVVAQMWNAFHLEVFEKVHQELESSFIIEEDSPPGCDVYLFVD